MSSRHVKGGVQGSLGRLSLLSGRVDGGQGLLWARDLARGAGFLSFRHGGSESTSLFAEEVLEFKGALPEEAAAAERRGGHGERWLMGVVMGSCCRVIFGTGAGEN